MALTATATKKVRKDIIERLWLKDYKVFISWFDRKNITIIVREISKKEEKMKKVIEIIEKTKGFWIIYCASRKNVKEVYDFLLEKWIKVWMYTWAMNSKDREVQQNDFMNWDYKVIVATNAFGMWIDKKDIRFVIHYNLPWSIENYYQEVWRAWRDWKNSYWVVIASFWDTKIQEFFIENTYPTKEEILTVYDYLYKWEREGWWEKKAILKTYVSIASESGLSNDMKVWSALKILEKYWIIKRWVDSDIKEDEFRWRWITLLKEKRKHSHLLIDWSHQNLLKEEAYYKLEQIKKLLFYPSCRKKFILNYFWDEEDLKDLWNNCWKCDYCIEKKKIANTEIENYVNISVFALILDVVKNNDAKIWVVMMTKFLWWSKDKKLIEWNMHKKENFWALEDLDSDLIQATIESLISLDYLYKTEWMYPLLWISETWKIAILNNTFLKEDNNELQHHIRLILWKDYWKNKKISKNKEPKKEKWETYNETLSLFLDWKNVSEISQIRSLKEQTIENHIINLYLSWKISLNNLLKLVDFQNVKFIKNIINDFFSNWYDWLRDIKDKCKEQWKNISRIEINSTIAMIKKWDL
jgi:ATP-dependent DNA helicase RecQ